MIRFDRLNKLADYLEVLPPEKFDFGKIIKGGVNDKCGCSLFHCPVIFNEWQYKNDLPALIGSDGFPFIDAHKFFGLSGFGQGNHLFMGLQQNPIKYGGEHLQWSATPLQVANNIRSFISKMKEK